MHETIGQRLKNIRLARRISLEQAAEATRVRVHYLQALEADNYSVMSSAAQSRGFLRLYAEYLGLDLDAAMKELSAGDSADAPPAVTASAAAEQTPAPVSAPQTPPASSADDMPVRRPFWARLLGRSISAKPAAEPEAASETVPAQEPMPEPMMEETPAPVAVSEMDSAPTRTRKPAAKRKPASAAAASKSKSAKSKPAATSSAKRSDKKKASPKTGQSKKRR